MCTGISYINKEKHYFGRNLDLEYHYNEEIVITPSDYDFGFSIDNDKHYQIMGVALVSSGVPLYYDACNEHGLCIAGLNFPEAVYYPPNNEKLSVPSYMIIPYLLRNCKTVEEVRQLVIGKMFINDIQFDESFPTTPLHWIISDKRRSIVIEQTDKLRVYENKVGVLTNSPSFDKQLFNLNNYSYLSSENHENTFSKKLDLRNYSRGMGAMGLCGDYSSMSRFIKASFVLHNITDEKTEHGNIIQFFNVLDSVKQVKGCVKVDNGYEYTVYSTCYNATDKILYYKSYFNTNIEKVILKDYQQDGKKLIRKPLYKKPSKTTT